jgi:hypothetical protein
MAGQRQIRNVIGTPVLARDHVFNVKGMKSVMLLRQTTIFATMIGTLADPSPQFRRH